MTCPDEDQLSRYVYQRGGPDSGSVAMHLDGCASCRLIVSELFTASSVVAAAEEATPLRWLQREVRPRTPGEVLLQGRYRLDRPIGAGGMGVVYEGWDALLERKVALKLLRAPGPELTHLLLTEARALAKLSHPNVVQIHDVGAAGEDEVFLAMELIDGDTVLTWLQHKRGPLEVLEVFDQAGRGLAAAHAAGLVHGDVKAANLLVGKDGKVVVSDFGLAEAPEPSTPDGPKRLAGTPAYLAPERLRGEVGDARSDQFGFCLTLWESLYGAPPFGGRTVGERLEAIAGGAPVPPAAAKVPLRVQRALARGLASRPEARFPSMGALLEAMRPSPWWRGRRARAVAMAALVLVLVGAAGQAWWRARLQAARVAEAQEAMAEIGRLTNAGDYLKAIEAAKVAQHRAVAAGAHALAGKAIVQRSELQWKARQLEASLASGHEAVAYAQNHHLDSVLGDAWLSLSAVCRFQSRVGEAAGYVEQAEALAERTNDRKLKALVKSEQAALSAINGELAKGVQLQREVIPELEALYGPEDPLTRRARRRLGRDASLLGNHAEAEAIFREDLEIEKRLNGPNHPEVGRMCLSLSGYVGRQGRLDEVVALVNEARRIFEADGKPSVQLLDGYNNLTAAYTLKGDYAEALKWGSLGLELAEREYGRDHEKSVNLLSNLGTTEVMRGQVGEGLAHYRDALARLQRAKRWESRETVEVQVHAAAAHFKAGRMVEAEAEARRALEMGVRLEEGAVVSSWARAVLGAALWARGQKTEALAELSQGHADMQPQLSPVMRSTVEFHYGRALVELKRDGPRGEALIDAALERLAEMPDLPPALATARAWRQAHPAPQARAAR